ncbi:MAG: cobalamin-dependent protein [Deltaproteobacteria bacterium]|jgi:methylmalonyl-CoA mutase cobalamin-binding subunit|nr:cobalamin-dependent protein [Deltaproteobacteria bacterium]
MNAVKKTVLLVPVDPVHDIALKMISRALAGRGHKVVLLPPDLPPEEIIEQALAVPDLNVILMSRTIGYGVGEIFGRLMDLADASGLRDRVAIALGGMGVRKEMAAELGFDQGFGPDASVEDAVAFVEGAEVAHAGTKVEREYADIAAGYDYRYLHAEIGEKLSAVSDQILRWVDGKTSPGVERAHLRETLWRPEDGTGTREFRQAYGALCGGAAAEYYANGTVHPKTHVIGDAELRAFAAWIAGVRERRTFAKLRHGRKKPIVFNQYGTGCPLMDMAQAVASEAWGIDGVVHFDPSWGARCEGLLDGILSHQEDGTVITPATLALMRSCLHPNTLWQVRAHRGLNTPETVVLAGKLGVGLTKINMCYGSLGAGTDPERLVLDGYHAIRYAVQYSLPFDVVTNEELCGVPAHKAFAGMLVAADLARRLGARPILQPLFANSPEVMIHGFMQDNYVDFNAAKIYALRGIVNAPIWAGAPIGFLTHTEDRVQSALTTALHAALGSSLELDAISIASADEAYSGGPITGPSKVDTIRATAEAFRFFGKAKIAPTGQAKRYAAELTSGIQSVLDAALKQGDFVASLYGGVFGTREDGAYPGRAGKGSVSVR